MNAASSLASGLISIPHAVESIAQCLLQVISNSSPATLKRYSVAIINPTITSMAHTVDKQNKRTSQITVSCFHLRIIMTMLAKVGISALIDLPGQMECIRCFLQIPVSTCLNVLERLPGAPAQSSFSIEGPPRERGDLSTNWEASSTVYLNSTPTEPLVQLRLDTLSLRQTITDLGAKALYPFWAQLFPVHGYSSYHTCTLLSIIEDEPETMMQIKACGVIKAMLVEGRTDLAIAKE